MKRLPKVVASSVIRATKMGDSHGGIYFVDLDTDEFEKKVDWHKRSIDWQGRGGERGLRGIAFYKGMIYCAANDEVIVLDQKYQTVEILKNRYLSQCHEMFIHVDKLYITSTRHDHIVMYDLVKRAWTNGFHIRPRLCIKSLLRKNNCSINDSIAIQFNASGLWGPMHWKRKARYHINMAFIENDKLCLSGVFFPNIMTIRNGQIEPYATIPAGTHNAQPYKDNLLYNHTMIDSACLATREGKIIRKFPVPRYSLTDFDSKVTDSVARQAFARGLCYLEDELLIVGSSPATITVFNINTGDKIKSINLSRDIRNAIHGLEIWPY